jgi:hypothetical protein
MMFTIPAWADTSKYFTHKFIANFAISGDSLHHSEHAVAIADTAAARAFWANNPPNNIIDPLTNNWTGKGTDIKTLLGQFMDAYKEFEKEGYPSEYLEDYANVYMMWNKNMGIKFYRKVNGVFKELNFTTVIINGKSHYRITISQ